MNKNLHFMLLCAIAITTFILVAANSVPDKPAPLFLLIGAGAFAVVFTRKTK